MQYRVLINILALLSIFSCASGNIKYHEIYQKELKGENKDISTSFSSLSQVSSKYKTFAENKIKKCSVLGEKIAPNLVEYFKLRDSIGIFPIQIYSLEGRVAYLDSVIRICFTEQIKDDNHCIRIILSNNLVYMVEARNIRGKSATLGWEDEVQTGYLGDSGKKISENSYEITEREHSFFIVIPIFYNHNYIADLIVEYYK